MPLMHLIRNPVKVWARLNYELNRIRRLPPKLLSRAGQPDIQKLFKLLETYAHDSQYGGYKEFFHRDWQLPSETAKDYRNNASPTIKTQDTHLHLLEALTPYYRLTKEPLARERLLELIMIQANTVLRKWVGASTDRHQFDWTPFSERRYERVNYGHDLENIWLLTEACNAIGLPNALFMDLYRTLFDYALKYGFDKKKRRILSIRPLQCACRLARETLVGSGRGIGSCLTNVLPHRRGALLQLL